MDRSDITQQTIDCKKLKRPNFTKEETLAIGTWALSLISKKRGDDVIADPWAEKELIWELEGFTLSDFQQMYQNREENTRKMVEILKQMLPIEKKTYSSGFVAHVIKHREDGGNSNIVSLWHWITSSMFDYDESIMPDNTDTAIELYNRFEHGHLNEKDAFDTLLWINEKMSQKDILLFMARSAFERNKPLERTPQKEIAKYANKTIFKLDDKVSFTMIRVDGGTFTMGGFIDDEDAYFHERPRHEVNVSTFLIGETQVTQELWEAVMGDNPSHHKGKNKPVEMVSWHDCRSFVKKLNEKTGRKFRLPTEAEWEYAARGGQLSKKYTFSGSNDRDEVAWHPGNRGSEATHDVKTKLPNELGIYDMSGNVLEWVSDWFGEYPNDKQTDPLGPSEGRYKVLRGGSWYNPSSFCRVSFRNYMEPESVNFMYGLRLAL